jgi:hypothetical protein
MFRSFRAAVISEHKITTFGDLDSVTNESHYNSFEFWEKGRECFLDKKNEGNKFVLCGLIEKLKRDSSESASSSQIKIATQYVFFF